MAFVFLKATFKSKIVENTPVTEEPVSLCYIYAKETPSKLFDKYWIRLDILGNKVSGEFDNIPAEKDSKTGDFEGTVGPVDQKEMARTADVWWNTFGEGITAKEQLLIKFGDGSASPGAGELIDRGDGVYVYKDKNNLFYNFSLSQISCEDLNEINFVEKYIRDNIKTIAINKPVLGGSWYVMSVQIIPSTKSGTVVYEDGHIQSRATFNYELDDSYKNVIITDFKN
jgi:hypothetical protein